MKIIICDKCGCTDKRIGKAQIFATGDKIYSDNIGTDFIEIDGYDLCGNCYSAFNRNHSIKSFIGVLGSE